MTRGDIEKLRRSYHKAICDDVLRKNESDIPNNSDSASAASVSISNRNRKGKTPHIVVVVGETLPSRIASLAYGTGDIDCVYHFALREMVDSTTEADNDSEEDLLNTLIAGRRLRDISDLPFDLAT